MADDSVRLLLSGSFGKEIRYWDGHLDGLI